MLDQAAVRKVAEDYCEKYCKQHHEITIGREIKCTNPASTYFSFRHSVVVTGGIAGILVFHDTGRYKDFGSGWHYEFVENFCKKVFDQCDPSLVVDALLHPHETDHLVDLEKKSAVLIGKRNFSLIGSMDPVRRLSSGPAIDGVWPVAIIRPDLAIFYRTTAKIVR